MGFETRIKTKQAHADDLPGALARDQKAVAWHEIAREAS
jgi:hypothetical protein